MSQNFDEFHVPGGGWRFSSFRETVRSLVAETVRIQTNDSAFFGKLAAVQTTYVTLAQTTAPASVHLTYIPFRHINAVTAL